MRLFYTKRSPYARKVRVMALEKKINLELIEEDLTKKSTALVEANPLGKIPALEISKGKCICDSPVICEYLESLKSTPKFIPANKTERFKVLHGQAIADGLMDNTVALYMEKVRHPENYNQDFVRNQENAIARTLEYFENDIPSLEKLNLYSVAVASAVGYMNFRLPQLNPQNKYPKLAKWYEEFSKRPSMEQTKPVVS